MEVSGGLEHEFYIFLDTPRIFIIPTDELRVLKLATGSAGRSVAQEFVDQMIPGTLRIYGLGAFNVARRG